MDRVGDIGDNFPSAIRAANNLARAHTRAIRVNVLLHNVENARVAAIAFFGALLAGRLTRLLHWLQRRGPIDLDPAVGAASRVRQERRLWPHLSIVL
jgi:hypothetical protein